ncbi:unnamed protein product [Trypanosoma congolense IL3000]|uniref:WGS project CAEQ00000000 data, annotated contig 1884 n=1 Tax=Trypanosoma congolense (strain IL3000) TaxID=1068625 RepID=F9W9Q4_TRYCI|nr:unnamed protein product [Trypanosoma congolense IL3000]
MAPKKGAGDVSKSLVSYLKDEGVLDAIRPLAEQKDKVEKIANMVRQRVEGKQPPPIEEALWSFLPVLRHAQETTETRKELSLEELAQVLGFAVATNEDFENPAAVREMKEWAESMRDLCQGVDGIRALDIFTGLFLLHGPSLSLFLFLVCSLAFDVKKGIQTFKEAWDKWLTQAMKEGSPEEDQKCVTAFVNVAVRTVAAGLGSLELAMEGGIPLKGALEDLLGVKIPLSQSLEDRKQWNEYMARVVKHFGSFVEPMAGILRRNQIEPEQLHQYAGAMGELRDLIAEAEGPIILSAEGDHWTAQLWSKLLEAADHMVTTVVEASGDPSRRMALLEKVQASLKGLPGLLAPRKPVDPDSLQLGEDTQSLTEEEVVEHFQEAVETGMEQRARMRTAVRELLESRLKSVSSAVFLNGGDAMVQEIQRRLLSCGQPRQTCGICGKPEPRKRCTVCLMLILCGEDDSGKRCYEAVKDLLRHRNEAQYLFFRDTIDSEFNDFLKDKVTKIAEEVSDLQGEVYELEQNQQGVVPNEDDKKRIKKIEQRIQEEWPEDLKKLFKDRLEKIQNADAKELERRQKLACQLRGKSLVISKFSLKISEVNLCLQKHSRDKYEELVLFGELEMIADAKLRPLPSINVKVFTMIFRLEEGVCERDEKGRRTFTIDTSGGHGSPGKNGRDGADYGTNGHKGESEDGEDGQPGGDGEPGQSAGHVYLKANTVLVGKIVILANGGNGGNGGDGGNGGKGKEGRDGEDGDTGLFKAYEPKFWNKVLLADPPSSPVAPGRGGNAGRPGARGGGGKKGDVKVLGDIQHLVQVYAEDGKAGAPGKVGTPGEPGDGGRIGKGYLRVWEKKWLFLFYEWVYREESARMPDTSREAASKILGYSTSDIMRFMNPSLWAASKILSCGKDKVENPTPGLYISYTNVEKAGFPNGMPTDNDTLVNGRVVSRDSLKGQKAEANQAVVAAQKKAKSNLDSLRYAAKNANLKGDIDEILDGREAATDRRDQNELADFSRKVNAFVSALDDEWPTLSLIDMIISTKCTTHIQISQAYPQGGKGRDGANRYQAPSRSPPWPRIGSCGLVAEIQGMPALQAYTDYLSEDAGNPSLTVEFAGCCAKLIRELCEEHRGKLVEGYAQFFAEKLSGAIQTHIKAERNYEALLQLYISSGGGKNTFHIGLVRQACLRQLYVVHVEGLWCSRKAVDKNTMVAARRAAERLKTCDPSLFDKLLRESGACIMCPQNVLSTLREPASEWEEEMKKLGMDVRKLILSTLGKHQGAVQEEPCVVEVYENLRKGLREAPGDSIWTEEATLGFFQWLEEINQEKAKEIRGTFYGLFLGENESCGTLFLDERNLRPGMTVNRALQLLLAWSDILLARLDLSREGFQKYVQALFNLSAADKRLLEELRKTEGQPPPLWSLVGEFLASRATLEELERARTQFLQSMCESPGSTQPTDAQRFLFSFLSTSEWCRWSGLLTKALEKVHQFHRLETCLCEHVGPEAKQMGSNEGEMSGYKIMQILMNEEKLLIPSPEGCGKCKEKLEKPIQKAYQIVEKEGEQVQREVAKQLNLKEGEKLSQKTFVEAVFQRLQQSIRASRVFHLHEKLMKMHEEQCQQPEIVEYADPEPLRDDLMEKLRDFEQAQQAQPPRPMALEELLSLCDGFEQFLLPRVSHS